MSAPTDPAIIVVSGLPGSGKSTTARLFAQRLPRAAHVEADVLQGLVVSGGEWPQGPEPSDEADRQLRLRLHHACLLARSFVAHGFVALVDDIVTGRRVDQLLDDLAGEPFGFVMLLHDLDRLKERWRAMGSPFVDSWDWIDEEVRVRTRRVGLWLDATKLTPSETVDAIVHRLPETVVRA